jgi:hypothetical protein
MIIQIRQLGEGSLTVTTLVGLLARVSGPHVHLKATLLREDLVTLRARILREVRVLMIHDQAPLLHRDALRAAGHAAAPSPLNNLKRKVSSAEL